jgi:uncharacterized protein YwqG
VNAIDMNGVESLWRSSGADEEVLRDTYVDAFDDRVDAIWKNNWPWPQLLGSPICVQQDPRYEVVANWEIGPRWLPSEEWARRREEIRERAEAWRLLLQIDTAQLSGYGEGTVYFLIRKVDLEAHRFDAVVPVIPQT